MGERIRVAVCDDARAVKLFLSHVLEEDGDMEVVSTSSTGQAALDELDLQHPHALLLDVVLPDVADASDLVRDLRARSPETAIVLMSNMPESNLEREAERVRADGWTPKAQKPEVLRATVRQAVVAAAG